MAHRAAGALRLTDPTNLRNQKQENNPQEFEATHPKAFESIADKNVEDKRKDEPSPSGIAVYQPPGSVKGCEEEYHEQSKADISHLQRRIQIAIMGVRHELDPARGLDDARRIGTHKPER